MEYRADKSRIYSCFLLSAAFSGLQFFIVEGAEAYGSIDISGKQEYNVCKRGLVKNGLEITFITLSGFHRLSVKTGMHLFCTFVSFDGQQYSLGI